MDLSFALQALVVEDLVRSGGELPARVLPVADAIDREVARLKLEALGVRIDELTQDQAHYLHAWEHDG
jgi:adenosylhomocysteinase